LSVLNAPAVSRQIGSSASVPTEAGSRPGRTGLLAGHVDLLGSLDAVKSCLPDTQVCCIRRRGPEGGRPERSYSQRTKKHCPHHAPARDRPGGQLSGKFVERAVCHGCVTATCDPSRTLCERVADAWPMIDEGVDIIGALLHQLPVEDSEFGLPRRPGATL
jgi:hypothetical protein